MNELLIKLLKCRKAGEVKRLLGLKKRSKCWFFPARVKPYIVLVAHIDTVYEDEDDRWAWMTKPKPKPKPQGEKLVVHDNRYAWSPEGLGADDRAGVYACLTLHKQLQNVAMLLTDEEECGGTGAYEATEKYKQELKGSKFLIQLDRRGAGEAVFYNKEPKEFKSYITSYGFTETIGTFSDISIIGKKLELCSVNLSVGYECAHEEGKEWLDTKALTYTMKMVECIAKELTENTNFVLPKTEPTHEQYSWMSSYYRDKSWNRLYYEYDYYSRNNLTEKDCNHYLLVEGCNADCDRCNRKPLYK